MSIYQGTYPILSRRNLAKDIFDFEIFAPDIARAAKPGQFVHIAIPGHALRRPISICEVNPEKETVRITFQAKGSGTHELAGIGPNSAIDVMGPLGNGFTLLDQNEDVLLVGGGIGVPPMVNLSDYYKDHATAITGFRNQAAIILQEDFQKNGTKQVLCTDDGTYGIHGLVTVPLEEILNDPDRKKPAMVYACGPTPMLRAIAGVCEKYDTPCEVSLEQHMGCGIGACLVCQCKIRTKDGVEVKRVCKDGPVFNAQSVVF